MPTHASRRIDIDEIAAAIHRVADALEAQNEIFRSVAEEEKPKPKEPVEKTCETCMCDPNCKADVAMACGHCYEYSEWEGFEC